MTNKKMPPEQIRAHRMHAKTFRFGDVPTNVVDFSTLEAQRLNRRAERALQLLLWTPEHQTPAHIRDAQDAVWSQLKRDVECVYQRAALRAVRALTYRRRGTL